MGQGKPILFVHGWGGNLYSLHKLALFAAKKYQAILIDLPGFGKSDNPEPEWGVEGYAQLIGNVIKKLDLKKPHYVGHSFGGAIGIYIASHYPRLIDSLILSNSSFKRENKISQSAKLIKMVPKKNPILRFIHPYAKSIYYTVFHKGSDLMKYPHLETNFRKIVTQDLTPFTKKIQVPTLILWGEEDTQTPVLWAYELKKNIAKSVMKVFPNVKHNLPLKYPQEVWSEIKSFLK
ncbi:MAG TPA: alpha/beta hydrolase [Candidatus Woesebacteria bacterium]|nr:alpha/beta hydrolase [Candidatus Woesebacteria bacterium]